MRFTKQSGIDLTCYFNIAGAFIAFADVKRNQKCDSEFIECLVYELLQYSGVGDIYKNMVKSKMNKVRCIRDQLLSQNQNVSHLEAKAMTQEQEEEKKIKKTQVEALAVLENQPFYQKMKQENVTRRFVYTKNNDKLFDLVMEEAKYIVKNKPKESVDNTGCKVMGR